LFTYLPNTVADAKLRYFF